MLFGSLKSIKMDVNLGVPWKTSCTIFARLCLRMNLSTLQILGVNFTASHLLKILVRTTNFLFYLNRPIPISLLDDQPLGFLIIALYYNFAGDALPTDSPKGTLLLRYFTLWHPLRPLEQLPVLLVNRNQNLSYLANDANHPLSLIPPRI